MNNTFKLTVGELKQHIKEHNLPDDAIVLVERVEDIYFTKHNWKTIKKEHSVLEDETSEYIEAFCTCKFKKDNNLYINCHY